MDGAKKGTRIPIAIGTRFFYFKMEGRFSRSSPTKLANYYQLKHGFNSLTITELNLVR